MPHGRSWKVLKPRIFETTVLPVFFESDNYHSFNRVINAWSFRRKSTGPDRGSYFHELFLRGKPHIQKYMRRLPRSHKKLTMTKSEEPDFFELEKASPLPSLEEAKSAVELRKVERLRHQLQQDAVYGSTPSNVFGLPTFTDGHGIPPHFFPPSAGAFQPRGHL
jgi:HSF-type DNA-binding